MAWGIGGCCPKKFRAVSRPERIRSSSGAGDRRQWLTPEVGGSGSHHCFARGRLQELGERGLRALDGRASGARPLLPATIRCGSDAVGGRLQVRTTRSSRIAPLELLGRRIVLRTLAESDYEAWREVRIRSRDWLLPWEPRPRGAPAPSDDRASFVARCAIRDRERQLGTGYGFGIFVVNEFVGEITLSSIQRGPFQSGFIGYWIDQLAAGQEYVPEAVVTVLQFSFETLGLHRIEISIIPRNRPSRRVVEKLALRLEGLSERFLEIDGKWEDHLRYAITTEEWEARREELAGCWT